MAATVAGTFSFGSARRRSLGVGLAGLLVMLAGFFVAREHFFRAWLYAYLFWTGLGLGCMGILLLHNVTGGNWGVGIRRLLESGAGTLPLLALLFIPLAFGLKDLYIWARPDVVAHDAVLQHKSLYLNVPFLLIRALFYFSVWIFVSSRAAALSLRQDREDSRGAARSLRVFSGPGLILYILTMTFASVDWVMSLDPHWFSTMFGVLLVVGQILSAFAFLIPVTILLSRRKPLSDIVSASSIYDLGNLLLAFVMIWAYLAFSQYLIIWAGNLPEEIPWYLRRLKAGWQVVGLAIVLLHFALPFMLLISRGTKRSPRLLALVASLILFMRLVEIFWIVAPATDAHPGVSIHWLDLAAPVGIGGLWLFAFFSGLEKRWDVPASDHHTVPEGAEA